MYSCPDLLAEVNKLFNYKNRSYQDDLLLWWTRLQYVGDPLYEFAVLPLSHDNYLILQRKEFFMQSVTLN